MKNVKKPGRLQLNRETLRSLNEAELAAVGGASGDVFKCTSSVVITTITSKGQDDRCGVSDWLKNTILKNPNTIVIPIPGKK